jgi:solute carrier family 13 (sodium-dependent dicarboxylate transporter), member 2/3/5
VGEQKSFDGWRARVGLPLGPMLFLLVLALGDGSDASRLAGLFAWTAAWWITEAIHPAATALLAVAASIVMGLATPKEAFAALGNPILFLFVGGFMVAEAMHQHGLGLRFATMASSLARGRLGALIATSGATFLLSMWTSNAASTAIVLPIALSIARGVDDKRYASAMVLAIAWGASMGGIATPVGTPPNLIGMRALADAGLALDFFGWMKVATPIAVVMLVTMWLVLALMFRVHPGHAGAAVPTLKPWSRGEVAACAAFSFAVVMWLVPGVLDALGSPLGKGWKQRFPEEVVAILAAGILFIWPIHKRGEPPKRALSWQDATTIDWGTVLLFGGGILLGDLANKTGLATTWGRALVESTGVSSTWAVVALVTAAALVLSELASNTASATLMVPVAFALAQATGTPPIPAVLGVTIGASFGFMMPISTAPNAMAYATGAVTIRQMVMTGIVFDVVGFVVVVAVLRVLCPLFGLS